MACRLRTRLRGLLPARLARSFCTPRARWRQPARGGWRLPIILMLGGLSAALGSGAHAVGLGEVSVDSALNQRLEATIPLIDIGDLQPDELRVTLASAEDFERVGVERFFFLSDLRFRVEVGRNGGLVLVTSEIPVTEPYLNFLVQLQWPQGRLLKEFTILLDPPTYSQAAAPAVRSAVQAAPDVTTTGVIDRPSAAPSQGWTAESPAREPARAPVSGARASGERVGNEYRMGDGAETLWSIASRHRPSAAVSVQQTMLAIQRLNPDAFVDGNINRLKWGQTLRLPDEAEARAVGAAEALEQVALQDRDWRSGVATAPASVPQPAATERAAIDATPERAEGTPSGDAEGRLRIVAGSDEGGAGGSASPAAEAAPAAAAGAGEDLAAALEERDRLSLEVTDLTSELDREKELAANQLAVKDRQIEVKDRQIAEMQAELARLRAGEGAAPVEKNQDQSASGPAAAWWQSPAVVGAGAGVLVLLLALALLSARRRRAADNVLEQPAGAVTAVPAPPLARVERAAVPAAPTEPASVAAPVAVAAVAAAVPAIAGTPAAEPEVADVPGQGAEEAPGDEQVDVIGEADIYVAYGRYGQAVGLLQNALGDDPDRHDVRLKLLEVYAETGDREGFDREQAELVSRCSDEMTLSAAATLAGQFSAGPEPVGMPTLEDLDLPVAESAAADVLEAALPEEALPDVTLLEAGLHEADVAEADTLEAEALEELEFELPDEPLPGDDDVALRVSAATASTDAGPELEFEAPLQDDAWDTAAQTLPVAEPGAPLEIEGWAAESAEADVEPPRGELLGGDLGIEFRLEESDLENLDADALALEMDGLPQEPAADEAEFEFADEGDSASTKLDLARAYKEMGDPEGAREILLEVLKEGSDAQQQAAQELLDQL